MSQVYQIYEHSADAIDPMGWKIIGYHSKWSGDMKQHVINDSDAYDYENRRAGTQEYGWWNVKNFRILVYTWKAAE